MIALDVVKRIVVLYDWIAKEKAFYQHRWEETDDEGLKTYYGEKASTYTSIKLYMEKYLSDVINRKESKEN